jgi:hypothetical protein
MFNASSATSVEPERVISMHQRKSSELGKENECANRGIIRIKPRKFMGSCHFLWCKEGRRDNSRSELVQLEREDFTAAL